MDARRRPGPGAVALLAFFAFVMVTAFARGEFDVAFFVGLGGSFLTMELWAIWTRTPGATFSERWWDYLGIRPRRRLRLVRSSLAGVFLAELLVHIVLGGTAWYSGSLAIAATAVPLAAVVAFSLLFERRVS